MFVHHVGLKEGSVVMRLEDALLCLVLTVDGLEGTEAATLCRDAIKGGVDMMQIKTADKAGFSGALMQEVGNVCREEDALFIIADAPELARHANVAGVHLDRSDISIGQARSIIGMDQVIGLSSSSVDEAMLALEIGADYLMHNGGTRSPSDFNLLKNIAGVPLFAAGIGSIDEVGKIVDGGVYRLCIESEIVDGNEITEQMSQISRMLGRCI